MKELDPFQAARPCGPQIKNTAPPSMGGAVF